jgi:hypothetical protein
MEDVRLKNCPEFENWLLTEREQWRNQVTVAVQKLVTHHLARQEQDQALYFLNRLLKLNPWQEEAHHQLMLLLARRGQRSAALVQYKTCKRVLNEELGVEPSADIIDLYQRIRAMETPPPKKLPMSAIPFIGRQTEIARVIQGLDDPHCRMLTLHGPGGVGKTRLALAAAHQLLSRQYASFLHGVFFISLAAIESSSQMIVGLLNALQISMRETSSPQATLLTCLKNKEMLLILDSMEHIPAGKELLGQILLQAPQVKFLLTSQVSLNLQWEWLIEVSGLPQSASKMGPSEAAQLFQQITRRTAGELVYSPQDMPHIDHICRLVEGLPLALKLAAEATSHTALPTIAAQIEQNCDILTTSLADVSPRQRNLRATFDYSWQMLTPEEQRTMEHLSGFQGEFTLEIAKQVSEVTLRDILALIEKSFLYQVSPGHFRCHRVLRKFAAEKLQQTPVAEKTAQTHG